MIRNFKDTEPMTPKQAIALLIAMILMSAFFSVISYVPTGTPV